MLEAVIKKDWPEDFKRIIAITYRFSAGWRKVHNPTTGHDVADNLTTTEFAAAMLAARGWTNQEIGEHMEHLPPYRQTVHFHRAAKAEYPQPSGIKTVYAAVNAKKTSLSLPVSPLGMGDGKEVFLWYGKEGKLPTLFWGISPLPGPQRGRQPKRAPAPECHVRRLHF